MSPRRYSLGQRAPAVDLTRARILAATREVLATQDRLSIDAVAQAADVARMTVYNQFGSRVGLLEALFDWLAVRGGIDRLPMVFQQPDPDLALEAFIVTFFMDFGSVSPHGAVDTRIEDGAPVAAVTVAPGTDLRAVETILGRYAITCELAVAAAVSAPETSTKE